MPDLMQGGWFTVEKTEDLFGGPLWIVRGYTRHGDLLISGFHTKENSLRRYLGELRQRGAVMRVVEAVT